MPVTEVLFSPDGTRLFAGSFDLITWDLVDGDVHYTESYQHEVGLAIGGDYLVTAKMAFDNAEGLEHMRTPLNVRHWETGEVVARLLRAYTLVPQGGGGGFYDLFALPVAIRPVGSQLASVDPDGTVSLWDLITLLQQP